MAISPLEIMKGSILCHEGRVKQVVAIGDYIQFSDAKVWIGGSMVWGEPISDPWLSAFGFEYDQMTWGNGRIWLAPADSGYDVFINGLSGGVTRTIEYLHQLQILYFGITGEHLKISKIKK